MPLRRHGFLDARRGRPAGRYVSVALVGVGIDFACSCGVLLSRLPFLFRALGLFFGGELGLLRPPSPGLRFFAQTGRLLTALLRAAVPADPADQGEDDHRDDDDEDDPPQRAHARRLARRREYRNEPASPGRGMRCRAWRGMIAWPWRPSSSSLSPLSSSSSHRPKWRPQREARFPSARSPRLPWPSPRAGRLPSR